MSTLIIIIIIIIIIKIIIIIIRIRIRIRITLLNNAHTQMFGFTIIKAIRILYNT